MIEELKFLLMGLLYTTLMFALGFVFAYSITHYNEATLVVSFLGLSYWSYRTLRRRSV